MGFEIIRVFKFESLAVPIFLCLSMFAVIELNVIILATFKKRQGLYFWSLIVATNGIAPYAAGYFIMRGLSQTDDALDGTWLGAYIYVPLVTIGWVSMVTGQAVVLYSRLHLVVRSPLCLRLVLAMIIINAAVLHIPGIVVFAGFTFRADLFLYIYLIFEKVQVAGFFFQELIISILYIRGTFHFFSGSDCLHGNAIRSMRSHLLLVSAIIILLDFSLVSLELAGIVNFECALRAFVYSIKLKVEFSILNNLVEVTRGWRYEMNDRDSLPVDDVGCDVQVRLKPNGEISKPISQ